MPFQRRMLIHAWVILGFGGEPTPPSAPIDLAAEQEQIARQYKEFDEILRRAADLLARSDPDRSALLAKTSTQSRSNRVFEQLEELSERFKAASESASNATGDPYANALRQQEKVLEDMSSLLDLLLSEDAARRIRDRRERVERYLEDVQKLQRQQKSIRSQTERSSPHAPSFDDEARRLADRQANLAENAKSLAEKIDKEDAAAKGAKPKPPSSDDAGKPSIERSEPKEGEGKPNEGEGSPKEGEGQPKEGEGSPSESKGKPSEGEGKPSDSGDPSKGKGSQGQPNGSPQQGGGSQGESQNQEANDESTPGKKNVQDAQRAMEEARKQLEEKQREPATENQEKAIKELQKAIEELEKILKQLREEERLQVLTSLEARFRKMLQMQQTILDATDRLDRVPIAKRSQADDKKAMKLSSDEEAIVGEADQALLALADDGSAVALPEAVTQIRNDALLVVALLRKADTGKLTQETEQAIIAGLQEIIDTLRQEIAKAKEQKQQPQQLPQQGDGKQPLVDQLAELRLIRSMQKRVLERTEALAGAYDGVVPPNAELRQAVESLAESQRRIYRITRDMALEQNQ